MPRLPTGVPGFDAMVQGGLPVGSSVVLQGPPGQEKLRFALTFLAEGLKAGGSGLVVTSSQSPDAVIAELRELGVNLDSVTNENRLRVVDWYSWSEETVQDIEERGIVIRSSIDLTNLGVALSRAIASLTGGESRRAVIELLSPATSSFEVTQVFAFAQSAKRKFDRHRFTSLVLLEKEMHSGAQLSTLHQPFDGVIEIERTRSGDRIVRKIGVLHLKDTAPDPTFRVLEMSEAGIRVVLDTPKPGAPGSTARRSVLESQDERAQRLRLILQIASERLKLNPGDADALFAMAAAQATLDDAKGGLETLDRLADLDSAYPGLWVLKTKLHAKLGQSELAQKSRLRALQREPEAAKAIDATVPCPMCEQPIALDATSCANCGVKFTPTRTLEDELDDLGHAAIQQMVQEDLGTAKEAEKALKKPAARAPKPKSELSVPPPAKPTEKVPSKKGMTNGLVLERRGGLKAGRTNGLGGRTNGLRGRTNGLTNGLGRTNGLTNGVGRTNGLTNGLGHTNGLTNGLGRTNGLTNGLGRTNGITNGLGRTNGLTNGLAGLRSGGSHAIGRRGMARSTGWKLYLIPIVTVALLLLPLFLVPEYFGPSHPIQIDGQFNDWAAVATEAMTVGTVPNPNVDIVRFGIIDNLGPFAFYVQVAGSAVQGGGPAPGTMDSVRIFVDSDGSSATGYRVDGLGADRLIDVSGYGGTIRSTTLWEFDANRGVRDWGGWIKGTETPAAASGSQIEVEAEWLASGPPSIPVVATVHTASWDGQADIADFPVRPTGGSLSVVADPQVPDILTGNSVPLLRLSLTAHGQDVSVDSLHLLIAGTAPPASSLSLRLSNGGNVLGQVTPTSRDVAFSFPAVNVVVGSTTTLSIVGDFSATSGETFGLRLPSLHPFGLNAGAVGLKENPGARTLGYLGSAPGAAQVDGGFDEWTALSADGANDVSPRANSDIDLAQYAAQSSGATTFLYADVTGRILRGTSVPEAPRPTPVQGPPASPDTDRDTVPDSIDPLPLDFNNDGTPDAQTNGDYDGDLVLDYGFAGGTDDWLNTTLPPTFPAPYGGRPVTLYIGPTQRPAATGDDAIRIFMDLDNNTLSGYSIGGIGADRLVELRGKDGEVTQSAFLSFSGSFPGEWAWAPISPVTVGLGYHAVELTVPVPVISILVEASDFWGSIDSTTVASAFAPSLSSFKVSAAASPLSVPWTQVGPQPSSTLIDGNSNSVTTLYNHQRKVARAGDVAGDTTCDATNSDGCWYAVFYDQLAEDAAPTAASTETITTGTSCGGAFPTDIQTSNDVYKCYREANVGGAGGSAAFQAISAIAASTGPDVTVTLPAHAANDIFLLLGWVRDTDDTVSVTGWTAISGTPFDRGTTSRYWMFWMRAASSSETNPLFDKSGSTGDTYAAVITYRGAITTGNPWEVVGATSTGTADPASITGITTLTDNALVVVPLGYEDNNNAAITTTGTNPAAYTEHYLESGTSANGAITFSEALRTSAGATGTVSVDFDVSVSGGDGWGGKALSLAPPPLPNYQLSVKYDFASVPSGTSYTLKVEGFHTSGEDILVQVVDSTEATWTTRMTITKTSDDNTDQTYTLTTDEYDGGSPNIRFIGATESADTSQNDLSIDRAVVVTTNFWDRIILMRSSDTGGSTWGSQIILASGRTGDTALLLARDSGEPSIAIDTGGFLHVVWVSASAAGDQGTLNLVRYTKTTLAYPTQSELANAANWEAVTNVDDASPGFMPTVSTDATDKPHVAWSGSKTSGTVYYKNKAVSWTTVDHDFLEQTTRQTTGSTTYVDIAGASLPSTDFVAGRKYLIVSTAQLDSSNTADNAFIQTVHGSTAFPGSAFVLQPDATTSRFTYYRFVVWTAVSGEGVKLQFRSETGNTIGADQITIFKLDLGDLTENTDWIFNENTAGDTIAGTTWDGLASVTFTPSAVSDWLVMTTMTGDPDSTSMNYESRIARSGEATETQPLTTWEGNDATNDRYVQTLARVFSLTAVSNTFTQESRCDAACTYPRSYSSVFALNLNTFEDSTSVYTEAEIALSTTDFATQIQTASLTPTRLGDVWILGEAAIDVGTTGDYHKMRLQVDNVDQPGTQTSDAYAQADAWDSTDEFVTALQTVENLAASSHTFDLDASRQGTTAVAEDRVLFAVALSISLGMWNPTVSWGTTYTGLSVDVAPGNDYVSLARFFDAATDEIQYTVCKNLATSACDASAEFTKWDGTAGADTVVTAPEVASYPSLAHTYEANGDVWVAYAKDVDGSTRAIYARFLDFPSSGWQPAETVDSLTNTVFTKPSIGIDRNNEVHALYVATSGPQVYYDKRTSGTWGTRIAVDTSSDNPTLMVRAPNDVTYGTPVGGLYWKTTTSETYFYIPEFDTALVPVLGVLALGLIYRRKVRGKQSAGSRQAKKSSNSPDI